jgi:hypothetical protein
LLEGANSLTALPIACLISGVVTVGFTASHCQCPSLSLVHKTYAVASIGSPSFILYVIAQNRAGSLADPKHSVVLADPKFVIELKIAIVRIEAMIMKMGNLVLVFILVQNSHQSIKIFPHLKPKLKRNSYFVSVYLIHFYVSANKLHNTNQLIEHR